MHNFEGTIGYVFASMEHTIQYCHVWIMLENENQMTELQTIIHLLPSLASSLQDYKLTLPRCCSEL